MRVLYTSDNEQPLATTLEQLFKNFDSSGTKYYRDDIENELDSRGYYQGEAYWPYLILNLGKFNLEYRDPAMD